MNTMRYFAWLAFVFVLTAPASARIRMVPTYGEMTNQSDLIVIARPVAAKDTGEKTSIPNISAGNKPIPAVEMETTFEVLAILKGEVSKDNPVKIVLSHLRRERIETVDRGGPELVSFDPQKRNRYLLFLKRNADGRYSAVVGQTDPGDAVKDLGTTP